MKGGDSDPYFRKLTEQLQASEIETQTTAGEEPPGLTPAQVAEEKAIEARVALAALTPGLADDTSAAGQLVSFFEGALSSAQARGAGSEAIIELANQVKTARSNLESLSSPSSGGTNENADVQAQITQANERAEQATRSAQIAEQALAVFGGTGDIGSGGVNARASVIQNNYNYMLHPSDPAVLKTIGNAATAGIGLQGSRRAVRQQVGP